MITTEHTFSHADGCYGWCSTHNAYCGETVPDDGGAYGEELAGL